MTKNLKSNIWYVKNMTSIREFHLDQRFVSSTGNMEVLLSCIHSIVCAFKPISNCLKSCQKAAHNLKIYISIFFSWFYIKKYLKCLEEFSHWLKKYVLWFKSMSFCKLSRARAWRRAFLWCRGQLFNISYTWYKYLAWSTP